MLNKYLMHKSVMHISNTIPLILVVTPRERQMSDLMTKLNILAVVLQSQEPIEDT